MKSNVSEFPVQPNECLVILRQDGSICIDDQMLNALDTGQTQSRCEKLRDLGCSTSQPTVKMKEECDDRQCSVGCPPPLHRPQKVCD